MTRTSTVVGVPRELTQQNRMGRAGVTPASSVPRIQFSSGPAKALSDFSFSMFQMSSQAEDELDQQAQAEGIVEGAAAGATGSFETRDYTTIRNRAYNQAGIETFVSTLETRSIFATAEIQRQFANDPVGMQNALDQYHQGVAGELNGVSPGAGAAYLQRSAMRSVPAVEAARDSAYALTRDQAEAALIESQVALDAELQTHAANLFSDNPARSQAAATALQVVGQETMRVYDAVDPVTGRPLFSAAERATARAAFNERVFETATLSWFDQQEDQAAAYTQFMDGDFTFELQQTALGDPAGIGWINYTNQNARRNDPLSSDLISALSFLPAMGVQMEVFSGGQENNTTQGLGSTRHNHGDAADVFFIRDGRRLSWENEADIPVFQEIVRRARAAGVTGFGAGENYMQPGSMHIGFGAPAVWGAGGQGSNAPGWLHAAYNDTGAVSPLEPPAPQTVDMRSTMSPAVISRIDAQMRQRITFDNTMTDREQRDQDRALQERQEIGFTLLTHSYLNGDTQDDVEPLTQQMIQTMLEEDKISFAQARTALGWLAQPAPDVSDEWLFEDLQRRMYEGEDIQAEIQSSLGSLSRSDASALMSRNNSLNGDGMTEEQRSYLTMIRQTVAPEGILATLDDGASMRSFNAQDEYRKRIAEGEDASLVARDVIERARATERDSLDYEIMRLLKPRFAVMQGGGQGRIDVQQTAAALEAARAAGTISEPSYQRQRALVLDWARLQGDAN